MNKIRKFLNSVQLVVCTIVIVLIIICGICIWRYDFSTNKGSEVYKLIFQGSITGIVTLGGLLFTYFRQDQTNRCPCIIFQQEGNSSARQLYKNIEKNNCIVCCDNDTEFARKVKVRIYNTKEAWSINCAIHDAQIGAIKGLGYVCVDIILPDCNDNNYTKISINFQDVYGKKYAQTIMYTQRNDKYFFVSNQPK